jgi:molecular chaperone GrpE
MRAASFSAADGGGDGFPKGKDSHPSQKKTKTGNRKKGIKAVFPDRKGQLAGKPDLRNIDEEKAGLEEWLLRTTAELNNVLKRTGREKAQLIQTANADLIRAILPVLDDFDRSLKSYSDLDPSGFRDGIELIRQKLDSVLKSRGVTCIESVGQTFDVDKHEAVMQSIREGVPPDVVIEEFEKGYLLNGLVLRHAKVMVSA